ncbi:hypothetical protein BDW66DRAFT_83143 [Aspergillus desertorum]
MTFTNRVSSKNFLTRICGLLSSNSSLQLLPSDATFSRVDREGRRKRQAGRRWVECNSRTETVGLSVLGQDGQCCCTGQATPLKGRKSGKVEMLNLKSPRSPTRKITTCGNSF